MKGLNCFPYNPGACIVVQMWLLLVEAIRLSSPLISHSVLKWVSTVKASSFLHGQNVTVAGMERVSHARGASGTSWHVLLAVELPFRDSKNHRTVFSCSGRLGVTIVVLFAVLFHFTWLCQVSVREFQVVHQCSSLPVREGTLVQDFSETKN